MTANKAAVAEAAQVALTAALAWQADDHGTLAALDAVYRTDELRGEYYAGLLSLICTLRLSLAVNCGTHVQCLDEQIRTAYRAQAANEGDDA